MRPAATEAVALVASATLNATVNDLASNPLGLHPDTLVATPSGPVPIVRLRPGDAVSGAHGMLRVARADRLVLSARYLADRPGLAPLRIAAGALSPGVPDGDLLVGAATMLRIGDAAIPAGALHNGDMVRRLVGTAADLIDLVFDEPGCFLAQGVEIAPPAVDAAAMVRAMDAFEARAGRQAGTMKGLLNAVELHLVRGWVIDASHPLRRLGLEVRLNGIAVAWGVADRHRADLANIPGTNSLCGFIIALPVPLDPERAHLVQVCSGGFDIPGSPLLLDAAPAWPDIVARVPPERLRQAAERLAAR